MSSMFGVDERNFEHNTSPEEIDVSVSPPSSGASSVLLPLLAHPETPSSTALTPTSSESSSPISRDPAVYLEHARFASGSRSFMTVGRVASEESQVLGSNGSMLLYRLATPHDICGNHRHSQLSLKSQAESLFSVDSKYPRLALSGLVPYAFDPDSDEKIIEDDDMDDYGIFERPFPKKYSWSWRGITNVSVLSLLITSLLLLFIFYPVYLFLHRKPFINFSQPMNLPTQPNNTVQSPKLPQNLTIPTLIDRDTPSAAHTRTGFDGESYNLVFSDEFNTEGRTFYPGDDPYWEAVDLWYGQTQDLEWYDPGQAITQDGNLVLLLEQVETHGLQYRSGMLQGWNKFCFTNGYVEVNLSLPGPNSDAQGYVSITYSILLVDIAHIIETEVAWRMDDR